MKLLLQLATLFHDSGLRDRSGRVAYAKGLRDCRVPVLALAGNADLICPPIAVTGEGGGVRGLLLPVWLAWIGSLLLMFASGPFYEEGEREGGREGEKEKERKR